jgi:hypothetical protein
VTTTTPHDDACEEDADGLFERFHDRLVGVERERRDGAAESDTAVEGGGGGDDADGAPAGEPLAGGPARNGATPGGGSDATNAAAAGGAGVEPDGVAAALAAELAAGTVDDATRRALAEGLGVELDTSTRVRLDRLGARLNDVEAYADALETVLDRVGTDDDIVARIERLSAETAAVERTAREERTRVRGEVDGLAAGVEELAAEVARLRTDVETLDEWRRRLTGVFAVVDDDRSREDDRE